MRLAVSAAAFLLLTACSSTPPATTSSTTPPPSLPSSAAMKVYTWGESATSSDVLIQIDAPAASAKQVIGVDGKPDPAFKMIVLPITVTNKSTGQATVAVWARIGQQKVEAYEDEGGASKFLPGENGQVRRPLRVPVDAAGELTLEVYANVDQRPAQSRLAFKGPLP
jgi:hypothetical protein